MSDPGGAGEALNDPLDVRLAVGASEPLRTFNRAGILSAADIRVAERLCALAGERAAPVRLAAALAVRAPRVGHVHVDLARIATTAAGDADAGDELIELPWPEPAGWIAALGASALVTEEAPLHLEAGRLYLDRLWHAERALAAELLARCGPAGEVDPAQLAAGLVRLFGETDSDQARATMTAMGRRLAVVAGGPGTGKTTTVGRLVALLLDTAAARGERAPLVALAAPTGRAAARLGQAVREQAAALDLAPPVRELLGDLSATTLHRLLGMRPGVPPRFHAGERLPHDVVVVDETSMVSLSRMEQLVAAVRPEARLVLVGDPAQLASIEAGAVLGDIVLAGQDGGPITGSIAVLEREHRFGGTIAPLAAAVRAGDADAVVAGLAADSPDVTWVPDGTAARALDGLRDRARTAGAAVFAAAARGDGGAALAALGRFRILCAHRRGPHGVSALSAQVLGWLADAVPELDPAAAFFLGRPLLVTENDPELELNNGDTGVVVRAEDDRLAAVFERRGAVVAVSPARLGAVETVYAMTIHKSQGSQFDAVAVVLPPPESRLLTRELLYTALTRATQSLLVIGSEASVRAAVDRPIARASGLRRRLRAED